MTDNAIVLADNAIASTDNPIVLTDNAIVSADNAMCAKLEPGRMEFAAIQAKSVEKKGAKGFLAANCINEAQLVEWLRGFCERLLALPTPNDELAKRMVRLGELSIGEVSIVADDIGRRLGGGETNRRGAEDAKEREEGEADA